MDWVAGTALAVGVGSLALTWQSTRAAKRAIDTSIDIYEKQKKDNFYKEEDAANLKVLGMEYIINELTTDILIFLKDFKSIFNSSKGTVGKISFLKKDDVYYFGHIAKDEKVIDGFDLYFINMQLYHGYIFEAACISDKSYSDLVKSISIYNNAEKLLKSFILNFRVKRSIMYKDSLPSKHRKELNNFMKEIIGIKKGLMFYSKINNKPISS